MKHKITLEEIKLLRNMLDMTQTEFASALGVSLPTVTRWETRKNQPSKLAIQRIALLQRTKYKGKRKDNY